MRPSFPVGLIGGVATGKTHVAAYFKALGVEVIDTDEIAKTLVLKDQPAFHTIVSHFGADVLAPNGQLDRPQLRQRIFSNPVEREWLEALLHPLIREEAKQRAQAASSVYCLVAIPLLAARSDYPFLKRVLMIDIDQATQKKRLLNREGIDIKLADQIMASQMSRETRLLLADEVLWNDQDDGQLQEKVKQLHAFYCTLAHSSSSI